MLKLTSKHDGTLNTATVIPRFLSLLFRISTLYLTGWPIKEGSEKFYDSVVILKSMLAAFDSGTLSW